jgi:hypothetical protein
MRNAKVNHYIVSCAEYVYGVTITEDNYLQRHLIKFGGKKACVHIAIYGKEKIANIDGIGHGRRCALNKSLETGKGTEHMLKTALRFVCALYPKTKKFSLKDTSYVKCNDGYTLSLGLLYIAKYGQTWYQKKYDAKFEGNNDIEGAINEINKVLTSRNMKQFKAFYKTYLRMTDLEEKYLKECTNIYENSNTLREFIIEICNRYDCSYTRQWLPKLLTDIRPFVLENEEFFIHKSTVLSWDAVELDIEQTDKTMFEKKSKPFIMNVVRGGGRKYEYGGVSRTLCFN